MNYIFGRKPVLEAINNGEKVEQVHILFGLKGDIINSIFVAAKKRGIKVGYAKEEKFRNLAGDSKVNTQGVIAELQSFNYASVDQILKICSQKKNPLLLLLDSIQDTHNLGAIIRTAVCSGVDGIVLTKHNSASVNHTVYKTSAGAVEHIKIAQVNNLVNFMEELKKLNFWIFGSTLEDAKDYTKSDFNLPAALIMGNEEKGIRKLVAEKCDFLIKIPMMSKIQSLNVSVATGVILFEILRQRTLIKD